MGGRESSSCDEDVDAGPANPVIRCFSAAYKRLCRELGAALSAIRS